MGQAVERLSLGNSSARQTAVVAGTIFGRVTVHDKISGVRVWAELCLQAITQKSPIPLNSSRMNGCFKIFGGFRQNPPMARVPVKLREHFRFVDQA